MSETIYITATDVRFSAGKFNSRYRYLRAGVAGATYPIVKGRSLAAERRSITHTVNGFTSTRTIAAWRYNVAARDVGTLNTPAFTAAVQEVKLA